MSIKLLVDSGCDLSQELAKKYDIGILPFTAICNEVEYKDGIDITSKELNEDLTISDTKITGTNSEIDVAREALINLGYQRNSIDKVLSSLKDSDLSLEEIIKEALKRMI